MNDNSVLVWKLHHLFEQVSGLGIRKSKSFYVILQRAFVFLPESPVYISGLINDDPKKPCPDVLLTFKFFSAGVILNECLLNYVLGVHLVLAGVKSCRVETVLVTLDQLLYWLSHENSFCCCFGETSTFYISF